MPSTVSTPGLVERGLGDNPSRYCRQNGVKLPRVSLTRVPGLP